MMFSGEVDRVEVKRLLRIVRNLEPKLQKRAMERAFLPSLTMLRDETRRRIKRVPRARGGANPSIGFRKAYSAAGAFKIKKDKRPGKIKIVQYVPKTGLLNWAHFMEFGTVLTHPNIHRGWRAWRPRKRAWDKHKRRILAMTRAALRKFARDTSLTSKQLRERTVGLRGSVGRGGKSKGRR
tara:strand:- start:619 stop:1161 length:543 start_codon:yes stop_codon:yes gene_type:complete